MEAFSLSTYSIDDARYFLSLTLEEQDKLVGGIPKADVFAAFDYFIKNFNMGRPFILAGHSQCSFGNSKSFQPHCWKLLCCLKCGCFSYSTITLTPTKTNSFNSTTCSLFIRIHPSDAMVPIELGSCVP